MEQKFPRTPTELGWKKGCRTSQGKEKRLEKSWPLALWIGNKNGARVKGGNVIWNSKSSVPLATN